MIGLSGLVQGGKERNEETPLVDSLPSLQCPTATSLSVSWAINAPSLGHVMFGTNPDELDRTAYGVVTGMKAFHDRFFQIRLDGLEPGCRYYYRTATTPLTYVAGHIQQPGETVYGEVFSFETPDSGRETATFSVINDTHDKKETLVLIAKKLSELDSDYTVWNGDILGSYDDSDIAVRAVLQQGDRAFSTERPLLFVPGNHEYYGRWARNLPLLFTPWEHPNIEDRQFIRNFVIRNGPLAMIGLDTGDCRSDDNPEKGGSILFDPYRNAQRDWLERVLQSSTVATAPFVVAFCHIPLFDPDPQAHGGDLPISHGRFQRLAGRLWGPLFDRFGVQLVISGHTHRYRYDEATTDRKWAQIVGGGPDPSRHQVTLIQGVIRHDTLNIIVHEVISGKKIGSFSFPKRF